MSVPAFHDRRLYLLLTQSLCAGDPLAALEAALDGGVDLVQVREKPFDADAVAWIEAVMAIAEPYEVPVLINDRIDLALRCHSAGVHLGQGDLDDHAMGSLRKRPWALGLSTHDLPEMERALQEEPDYVGVGPCFATRTKGYEQGLRPDHLEALLEASPVPAYGIGGIHPGNLPDLLDRGLSHIAVSSCILASRQPLQIARELRDLLDSRGIHGDGLTGALVGCIFWSSISSTKYIHEQFIHPPFQLDPVGANDPLLASAAESWERIAYLQKVYSLVLLGIALFAFTCFAVAQKVPGFSDAAGGLAHMNRWLLFALMMGSAFAVRVIAHKPGIGLIGYLAYAVFLGLLISPLVQISSANTLMSAGITALGVFLGLTTYVFVTKKDFSWMGGILYTVLFGMIALGLCAWLFGFELGLLYNLAGALLFSGYILYDTSNVLHHNRTDKPIPAAVELFVDVVLLFWYLLALFNND